jgi:hypothetical protein
MHTVEVMEEALGLAVRSGFEVRQDWFGGAAAGACEVKGRRWIFVDLSLSPREQLEQLLAALREFSNPPDREVSPALQAMLRMQKAA